MRTACAIVLKRRSGIILPAANTRRTDARAETINLRATRKQKALIARAAEALGRSRSDFMLDTACREAEHVLLDQRYFVLSGEAYRRFAAMLDRPVGNNAKLKRLLDSKSPWER